MISDSGTYARRSSSLSISSVFSSWLVRKPSKKWMKGTRLRSVASWDTAARSWHSCTEAELSRAKPVCRTAITSW